MKSLFGIIEVDDFRFAWAGKEVVLRGPTTTHYF